MFVRLFFTFAAISYDLLIQWQPSDQWNDQWWSAFFKTVHGEFSLS